MQGKTQLYNMISVEDAIRRGERTRLIAALQIVWAIVTPIVLSVNDFHFLVIISAFLVGVIVVILLLNFHIQRWRLWALENVDYPKEFRIRAEELMLIPVGKLFDSLEYTSDYYRMKWNALQSRYDEHVVEETISIPLQGLSFGCNKGRLFLSNPITFFSNRSKYNLHLDIEKLTVNFRDTYGWGDISNAKVHANLLPDDDAGRAYCLTFLHYGIDVFIPLHYYDVNPFYLDMIIKSIVKKNE